MADWNKIFQEEYAFSQNGVSGDAAKYEQLLQEELAQMLKEEQSYERDLKNTRDERLRQAYVTKRKAEKDAPMTLAEAGISGGAAETTLMDILREYLNSRNLAESDYSRDLTNKTNEYVKSKNDITLKYRNLISDANEKARSEALKRASFAKQMAAEQAKAAASSSKSRKSSGRKSSKKSSASSAVSDAVRKLMTQRSRNSALGVTNAVAGAYLKGRGTGK